MRAVGGMMGNDCRSLVPLRVCIKHSKYLSQTTTFPNHYLSQTTTVTQHRTTIAAAEVTAIVSRGTLLAQTQRNNRRI